MKYKKQHYIPQSYLESWCDPETPEGYDKYVWMFDYNGETVKKKNPKNIFYESDMYTIFDEKGNRILNIEHGLSGLEDKFAVIRNCKLNKQLKLTFEERYYVLAFVAALHNRTVAIKEHMSSQWGKVLDLGRRLQQDYEKASPEQRKAMESIGPLNKEGGFITSDNPCVWFDPNAYKRPPIYQSLGLGYKSVEVTLPISPKQAILISHTKLPLYISVPIKNVDSINRKTRFSAEKYFVVNRNYKKDYWFEVIEPPKDSSDSK